MDEPWFYISFICFETKLNQKLIKEALLEEASNLRK